MVASNCLSKFDDGCLVKYEGFGPCVSKDTDCCCDTGCCGHCDPDFDDSFVLVNPGEPTELVALPDRCCKDTTLFDACEPFGSDYIRDHLAGIHPRAVDVGGVGYWRLTKFGPLSGLPLQCNGRVNCVWIADGIDGFCLWDEETAGCDDPDTDDFACTSTHRMMLRVYTHPTTGDCHFDLIMDNGGWDDPTTGWPGPFPSEDDYCVEPVMLGDCFDMTSGVMVHYQLILAADADCSGELTLDLVDDSGSHCDWPESITIQME